MDKSSAFHERLLNSYSAFGLFAGFTCNIILSAAESYFEYPSPILVYEPLITFLYSPSISSDLKGGLRVAIS